MNNITKDRRFKLSESSLQAAFNKITTNPQFLSDLLAAYNEGNEKAIGHTLKTHITAELRSK